MNLRTKKMDTNVVTSLPVSEADSIQQVPI